MRRSARFPVRWTARKSSRGFTLLEVIVALAILSVAVVASIQGFAQGLRLLKLAGDHQHATLLADEKLREVVTPKEGKEQGQDDRAGQTFAWERTTTAVEAPDLAPRDGTTAPSWRVWEVAVRVRWGGRREVDVATLRTAPAETPTAVSGTTLPASGTSRGLPQGQGFLSPTTRGTVPPPPAPGGSPTPRRQ